MEAYVNGVSTRAVDDLVAALGVESGISKSEVSRTCGGLDEQVEGIPQPTPRCFRLRKKPRQNTSSSESPTSTPNTSRPPGGGHFGRDHDDHQVSPQCRR